MRRLHKASPTPTNTAPTSKTPCINKKFQQLKSTIELLAENGWELAAFNDETIFVPLVVVPNAGIPPTVFADMDIKMRAHPVLGQLGRYVTSPGILIYHELD